MIKCFISHFWLNIYIRAIFCNDIAECSNIAYFVSGLMCTRYFIDINILCLTFASVPEIF